MKKITSIFLLFVFCFTSCHSVNHQQTKKAVEPHILVIFGATGDLAQRKLIPALNLNLRGELPESFICVGIGRKEMSDNQFREHVLKSIDTFAALKPERESGSKIFMSALSITLLTLKNPQTMSI